MFAVPNKSNSRFKNLGFAMFGGRPWRIQDLFANASADSGGLYTPNPLQYQTSAGGDLADDPGEPIGLILSLLGDQQVGGTGINPSQSTDLSRPGVASIPRGGRFNQFASTTETFTTRNFTTRAVQYTLSFTGTGTLTLSGTSTAGPLVGTGANDRVSLTFTPSAGTLTLTVSGSVTKAQIQFGASATAYQNVTSNFLVTQDGVPQAPGIEYFDGGDWFTLGTQTFGTASFFADAGQEWFVCGVFSTFASGSSNTLISKTLAGAAATRTFQVQADGAGYTVILNGSTNNIAVPSTNGATHVFLLWWDGANAYIQIDSAAPIALTVGAAAEEAAVITIGSRGASVTATITGYNKIIGFEDRALNATEITQLLASLNQTWRGI